MKLSLRWYGPQDSVPLTFIRQIPGVKGVVGGLHDIAPGDVWPPERIRDLVDQIQRHSLELTAIESLPIHEDIKIGGPDRDHYIDNYIISLKNLAAAGITTICYNFMPVFD